VVRLYLPREDNHLMISEPAACSNCGTIPEPLDLFCGVCGQSLQQAASPQNVMPAATPAITQGAAKEVSPLTSIVGARGSNQRVIVLVFGFSIIACSCLCLIAAVLSAGNY